MASLNCIEGNGNGWVPSPFSLVSDDGLATGRYKNVIFDIGGVLLQPNLDISYGTTVPPVQFQRLLRFHAWFDYQVGKISPEEAFHQLSVASGFPAEDLRTFARKARESLVPITQMTDLVVQLSKDSKLRLFAMTNSPAEDFAYLSQAYPDLFGRFERIFTSASTGIRKPDRKYFQHVLQETGISASETIFVDDYIPNLMAAEVLGFTAVQVSSESPTEAVRLMMFHLRTEAERLAAARDYLERRRGVHKALSLTSEGVRIPVNFDHFLIADVLNDKRFLPGNVVSESGSCNFFPKDERASTRDVSTNASSHNNFPDDSESTSLYLSVLHKFSVVGMQPIQKALDLMVSAVDDDGLIQLYFDRKRLRFDPVCATNAVYLFHLGGRPGPTKPTEQYIFKMLANRAYTRGSVYYRTPEAFLFTLARLVVTFKDYFKETGVLEMLKQRLCERVGMESNALTLALRIVACMKLGVPAVSLKRDMVNLAQLQNVDGSWDVCPYYSYHDHKVWFGNESVTTAYAIAALEYNSKPQKIDLTGMSI